MLKEAEEKDTLALRYSFIDLQLRSLLGRVLTFVDASYHDEEQRRAAKDVMKDIFGKTHSWIREVCFTDLSNKKVYGEYGKPFPEDTIIINQ
jgi:hypothetical protein